MVRNTKSPQKPAAANDCGVSELLYALIRKRVKGTKFTRRHLDPDEIANEVFVRLSDKELPGFWTEAFEHRLRRVTNHVVRDFNAAVKPTLDIDELNEDEHPFYEMDFFHEEENFERVFSRFCESFEEPRRTVFAKCRLIPQESLAALTGLSRREVGMLIKSMPNLFRNYCRDFSAVS